jgi:hypothetical protein
MQSFKSIELAFKLHHVSILNVFLSNPSGPSTAWLKFVFILSLLQCLLCYQEFDSIKNLDTSVMEMEICEDQKPLRR